MHKVHLITGGQRSGKSSYAQALALEQTEFPVYLATARIWDDDFKARVDRHQKDRGDNWETIEIPVHISQAQVAGKVVLLDCITLWLNNLLFENEELPTDQIADAARNEFDKLIRQDASFIIVSNEIGMGGHALNELARKFTDLQGWVNQYIASKANRVTLMVSGVPLNIK